MARGEINVQIEGLDDLRRNLRKVDDQLGKELGKVNKSLGQQVERWSQPRRSQMASQFPSYRSKIVKVKASANQRRVEVKVSPGSAETGTGRHPVFGEWMSQASFARKVWPEKNREGWLVRPTARQHETQISDDYLQAVSDLVESVIGD